MLGLALAQHEQARFPVKIVSPDHDDRDLTNVVLVGIGSSRVVGMLAKTWLDKDISIPFEIIQSYRLPHFVAASTLVIINSYTSDTDEVLAVFDEARRRNAQVVVITSGGALLERARGHDAAHVILPEMPSRLLTIAGLRAVTAVLGHFGILDSKCRLDEIADMADWLRDEAVTWAADSRVDKNYAKQLALHAVGKTPVFYGGELTGSIAYKWKISWNENAKNVAFWNEYPEASHNEFIGWTSHPIEKPFAVFDLVSNLEDDRILEQFIRGDRLLSGRRPKAVTVELQGEMLLRQLLWASILADFTSIYVGIMNNADPGSLPLIVKN